MSDRRPPAPRSESARSSNNDAAFRELFLQHPVPTWVYDRETLGVVEVNAAAIDHYGYTRDEFLAMRVDDLYPDSTTSSNGFVATGAARHRLKDGQVIEVELSTHELDFGDRPAAMVVARDGRDRDPVAAELRRSARQQRALLDAIPDLFFHVSRDGTYLAYQAEHEDSLAVPPGDLLGKRVDQVLPEPVARGVMATIERALTEGGTQTCEYALTINGVERVFETRVADAGNDDVVAVAREVTDRVSTEAELRASESRLQLLLSRAWELITIVDVDGIRRYVSPSSERVLGYTPAELVGRSVTEVYHPDDAEEVLRLFQRLTQRPDAVERFELPIRHRDGSTRWLEMIATNCLDDPDLRGVVVNARDVTERRRTEATLRANELRLRTLHASAMRQAQELTLMDRVRSAIAGELNLPTLFQKVVEAISETFGYSLVSLRLIEGDSLVLQHQVGYARVNERMSIIEGVSGRVARTGEAVLLDDVRIDPAFLGVIDDICSEICVPLIDGELVIGTLDVETIDGVTLGEEDLRLIQALGQHINVAIGRARLYAEARGSEARFRSLVQNAADVIAILDDDHVVQYVSPAVERVFGLPVATLVGSRQRMRVHPDDRQRVTSYLTQVHSQSGIGPTIEYRVQHHDESWRWIEVRSTNLLTDPTVNGIVLNIQDISERKAAEMQLAHMAFHDPLTGIANRALFADRLGHALAIAQRRSAAIAVLLLDLDGFKQINDNLGHEAGDILLVAISRRLATSLRDMDTVARLGGDEFAIILTDVGDSDGATLVAERLIDALRAPYVVEEQDVVVNASIGIALADGEADPNAIIRNADVALYHAKAAGRANALVFQPEMSDRMAERNQLGSELRQAMQENALRLQYEPQIELTTGDLAGVEAQVRWEHPARGVLSREAMVALADTTGLDIRLDRWIITETCRQACAWAGAEHGPSRVCVDLSTRHLQHPRLVASLAEVLQETGLHPARLVIGVKADAVESEIVATSSVLTPLKELGVGLAIDDFGVRYSSLNYLRHMPFDAIKINLSFLAALRGETGEQAVFRAIVDLAHALDMQVIVEGIETAAQLAYVRLVGCDQGQGSYFAHPLSSDEMSAVATDGWSEYRLPPVDEASSLTAPTAMSRRSDSERVS